MTRISLNGTWKLHVLPPRGAASADEPDRLAALARDTVPARVPGNVELDLERAGRLPDPFVGENIRRLRAYESRDWLYTTVFDTPPQIAGRDIRLCFHGLDCFATIWLNGVRLGETANMFVEHGFDVSAHLARSGRNELAVHLGSAVNEARRFRYEPSQVALVTNYEQLHVRKAPHMYGWDITPRAVSAGIWRDVDLEIHERTEIVDLVYATEAIDGDDVLLGVHWQFRTDAVDLDGFALRFSGECGECRFEHVQDARFIAGSTRIHIARARLWWPKGYGKPDLYRVSCELLRGGVVANRREDSIGLRMVNLDRTEITTASEPGEFRFRINGVPIMCKGTNWVPLDAFHSRDAERYEPVLALVDDLGCNIVRCWGGNVYEDTRFFSICDERGIMVWQDFAFACAFYPQDQAFLERVRLEAEQVVRKLRNHASLVLWSGDNEIDAFYLSRGMDAEQNLISRRVLPEVCAACDPSRPYLPSSPYVSPEAARRKGRGQDLLPEQHLWGPRDWFKSPFYAQNTAHFASEIGYHGCPNVSSIRRFIDEDHLWPWNNNPQWRVHAADQVPGGGPYAYRIKLMADQVSEMFGRSPDTLEEFALASQVSQAEAKKYFIEMFRIRKWRKTGIIWWNLIDCWPQFSDAVVDYHYGKKLAYHYIRRVQQPICVMIDEPEAWHCAVVVGNDTRESRAGTFRVTDAASDAVLLEGAFESPANENRVLGRIRVSHGEHRLFLVTWEIDGQRRGNHYLLGKPPFAFETYRGFLEKIAALPAPFDATAVAR